MAALRGPGFEWLVAWRHLRDPGKKPHRTLVTGLILIALGAAALAVRQVRGPAPRAARDRALGVA